MNLDAEQTFLGTGWSFPPTFDKISRGVVMVKNEDDIEESLRILLSTQPGERVMEPEFGCDLRPLVFEPMSSLLASSIENEVKIAVIRYEPRIDLNSVTIVFPDDVLHDGVVFINIDYTVRITNTRSNIVYPYYKIEGTNIIEK